MAELVREYYRAYYGADAVYGPLNDKKRMLSELSMVMNNLADEGAASITLFKVKMTETEYKKRDPALKQFVGARDN